LILVVFSAAAYVMSNLSMEDAQQIEVLYDAQQIEVLYAENRNKCPQFIKK
jgi:hypothetical protein